MEQLPSRGSAIDDPTDPSLEYQPFMAMEDLMDKLNVLNYEEEFIKGLKMRPFYKHYFAVQTNPGEQFFLMTSLAAWLVRKLGRPFEQPQEYDDPNSTVATVLDASRDLGIPIDFAPNKLKQGYGKHAIYILNSLADKVIEHLKFVWKKPRYPVEVDVEEGEGEEEAELTLERVEEEMAVAADDSDSDEDNLMHIDDLQHVTAANKALLDTQNQDEILESNTSTEEWRLEVERVLPMLKVTVKTDGRDWRGHVQELRRLGAVLREAQSGAKGPLERLATDVTTSLTKIDTRERFLNNQLEPLLAQYRIVQDESAKVGEEYRRVSVGVTERQKTLARLTDRLEAVKQEMDERGSSMTDGSPLVSLKKAMARVKMDIGAMNVRIGVLQYCLTQATLRDRDLMRDQLTTATSATN